MNALKEAYSSDLEVVGVPSNVFGLQEPGSDEELMNGYKYVRPGGGFVPNFPIASKVDVNGGNEVPLYTFLKSVCDRTVDRIGTPDDMYWSPVLSTDLNWNFEKFLIDQDGKPYKRYNPMVAPAELIPDIETLLARSNQVEPPVEELTHPKAVKKVGQQQQ